MSTVASDVWLRVPARPENVAVARQALAGLCEAITDDPKVMADVKLAVTEACTNVVVHAYRDMEVDEPALEVEAHPQDDELLVVVRDFGGGITPRAESPGLGLGLPLIAALSRSVELRGERDRDEGASGTEVVMTFSLVDRDDGDGA